jgi:hypothetical protein
MGQNDRTPFPSSLFTHLSHYLPSHLSVFFSSSPSLSLSLSIYVSRPLSQIVFVYFSFFMSSSPSPSPFLFLFTYPINRNNVPFSNKGIEKSTMLIFVSYIATIHSFTVQTSMNFKNNRTGLPGCPYVQTVLRRSFSNIS